jgi:hypothetical protein
MKGYSGLKRAGILTVLAVLLLTTGLLPRPVSSAGPVAISGSFYTQRFQIPVGGSVSASSIYVVAFNQGTEAATFIVSSSAPPDVTIGLSDNEFILAPSESRVVLVAVQVGADAVPGLYEVTVNVRAQRGEGEGVEVIGSAEEVASLSIVGEAGSVHAVSMSPRGDPVLAHIRLWKIIDGELYEIAESHTGVIDTIVSPGTYLVKAFSMGVELASQQFDVAHLEQKSISLSVETIYFKYFAATLARNVNTGAPGYAQVVYTITNVYEPVANAAVNLVVTFEGADLEMIPGILTLSALNTGDTGVPYQYFPGAGWEEGTYSFQLELYLGGQFYAGTEPASLDVSVPGGQSRSWLWWILPGVVGGGGLGILIFFLWKRRKKKKEEEKPRKVKQPAVKPEALRPPEPVRPVPPSRPVRPPPADEPAPLAAISSMRARMAAIERDQAIMEEEEESTAEMPDDHPDDGSSEGEPHVPVPPTPKIEP